MRQEFSAELDSLHVSFSELGMMVNEAIYKSVKAFVTHDKALAHQVIDSDHLINEQQTRLEQHCFELIALQQPVTGDLRLVVTAMKASSDLERMGDHAVSIAKSTIRVKGTTRVGEIEDLLGQMADAVKRMSEEVLDAYVHDDAKSARRIATEDHKINDFSRKIYTECITNMKEDADTVVGAMDYMLVASYLERIGDYVTNICEWIVYLQTGKITELNSSTDEDKF
ncbi:phosphate signaling complex protein PhoU [Lacticaseibacillus songhuajiangensis]|jgi:phosphate transport system protein|uniref:phosphate signaling complex protein PhoU n=1 Tax=Lacticaseibacillus songhuajiangensis TaxID=1296539 RepID=UPI000F7A22D3|nr:phosphate signaling complex protein PhoU [Lacticaseibacillus songhuajiangensis]MCI1283946.1 phosphate signaling complex protein PhoU [Lacticaseibacillus songhuajiangensis]